MRDLPAKWHRFWHLARAFDGFVRAREFLGYGPTHLWLEPTNACNLKCIHCPTGIGLSRPRGSMDFTLAERLISEASAFKPLVYFHLGGESLLHPRLPEMIELAGGKGLPTAMFTNGTLLDRARGTSLLESGLDWLGFSFDGLDSATFERIRRGANFERVLGNILSFLALKRERGSEKPYTYMSVVDLASPDETRERDSWDDARSRLMAAGLDHLEIARPHTWAGMAPAAESGDIGLLPVRPMEGPIRKNPGTVPVSDVGPPPPTPCPAVWSGLAVLWNGVAVPCCIDIEGRLPVGDLTTQSISEVWNGAPLRELRRAFATRRWDALPGPCQLCHVPREPSFFGIPAKAWTELKEELLGVG